MESELWNGPMQHPTRVGKYDVEQFLGGGMSHVYRARDRVLGRRVALKILTEHGAADAEAKARFLQEARMASNVKHENVISVYDFGEEQGRPFMVMEYLEGESLRQAIRNGRSGDFQRRVRIAIMVARALDYIHANKIIHRDVKPENIHIDANGKVTLMDFGIAKTEGVELTRPGFTLGTPYYMGPEQVLGKPLTPQADIYSYGVLLFELFTGTKPLGGESVEKIFEKILNEPLNLEPLKKLKLPPAIPEVIARCTAKDPAQRPQSLEGVCDQFEALLDRGKTSAAQLPENVPTITTVVPTPDSLRAATLPAFLEKLPAPLRSQGGLMLLAGVTVVAVLFFLYVTLAMMHVV